MEHSNDSDQALLAQAWRELDLVQDPELPISIVSMGLVRGLTVESGVAHVQLTYTSMGCPWTDWIRDDVRACLLKLEGIDDVQIEVVWSPVWTRADVRHEARETLRRVGIGL